MYYYSNKFDWKFFPSHFALKFYKIIVSNVENARDISYIYTYYVS